MANWKKVIVSQSNAGLLSLTASAAYPLKLSGVGINSSDQTPLVIDSDGNVRSGSTYLAKYSDNVVSASSLSDHVVIVGKAGSSIENASSTQGADFNSADVYGVDNITASAYHLNSDRQFATGSPDSGVILGDKDTKLYLTGSSLILSSSGGITGSILPLVNRPGYYVGTNAEGHLVKIATGNNVNSSILGVDAGDNIVIDGFSTTELVPFSTKTQVVDDLYSVTGSILNISNNQVLEEDDEIIIKYSNGTQEDVRTVLEFTQSVDGDDTKFGIKLTEAIAEGIDELFGHEVYKQVSTSTGTPLISLSDEVSITGSMTMSGDLLFSTSSATAHNHSIHFSPGDTLNISASNITASTIDADTYYLNAFAFSSNTALVTSGSTVFGDEASVDSHQFTGSVHISGGLNILHVGSTTGETFNVSTSLAYATQSIHYISGALAAASGNLYSLSSSFMALSGAVYTLSGSTHDLSGALYTLSGSTYSISGALHQASGNLHLLSESFQDLSSSVHGIKSFPYSGSDTLGGDPAQAVITGSLLLSGSGHITASGHISASAVTASNMHVATNLHVGGNLTVLGTNTIISSTNLAVEDRFILLGSGSGTPPVPEDEDPAVPAVVLDTGIIFESGSVGSGLGLFYDADKNRISIGKNINDSFMSSNTTAVMGAGGETDDGTVAGQVVTVRDLSSTAGTALTNTVGTGNTDVQFGVGEMVVDSSDEIWIYTG